MTLEILILLAACFTPTLGIHCEGDTFLPLRTNFHYQIVDWPDDLEYWRTRQNNFQVFGKFYGDPSNSIIKAGYYSTNDHFLIHGITVDCGKGKWSSQVLNKNSVVVDWLKGDLATPCKDGNLFDIWFKIHQPKMMSWIFDAQPLQYETRQTTTHRGAKTIRRTRTLEVPTKYGANRGGTFKVETTGTAKITRVTWGQCVSWPREMNDNCQGARTWVQARSKMATTVQPMGGLGHFGSDWQTFTPTCFLGSRYYDWLQQTVHPDRNSQGYPYCCCVDMHTGLTIGSDENACVMGSLYGTCEDKSCMQHAVPELIKKVMIEHDKEDEDLIPK